jgi:xanthine phosphoribosyltransferase
VIGVANGGIYPAGRVADQLGLDYREIEIKAYRGRSKAALEVIRSIDDPGQGEGLLVVDDIVDSGDTALAIRQMLPKAAFLSVYAKAQGLGKLEADGEPHLCAERFAQDVWIVFPWHQSGWAGEVPRSVARYRTRQGLTGAVPITRQ